MRYINLRLAYLLTSGSGVIALTHTHTHTHAPTDASDNNTTAATIPQGSRSLTLAVSGEWSAPLCTRQPAGLSSLWHCVWASILTMRSPRAIRRKVALSFTKQIYLTAKSNNFAPSAKGLQQLLDICSKFALSHNVVFNVVKSQCLIVSSRSDFIRRPTLT